jgi:hypothetical protein
MPVTDHRSRLGELQRAHVASTVHDAHDDDFGIGEAVVQRVVAMEVHAQAFGQLIPRWSDLRMVLDGLEARLDLPDQLRCRRAVVGSDEAPDLDQILLGALGQSELAARRCNRSSPRRMMRSASKSRTRPASMSSRPFWTAVRKSASSCACSARL